MSQTVDTNTSDNGNSTPQVSVPKNVTELLWDDKERTLRELISTYRLPLAVKLKSGDINKYCFNSVPCCDISNGTKPSDYSRISSLTLDNANSIKTAPSIDSDCVSSNSGTNIKGVASVKTGKADVILQVHETHRRKIILARKMTWDKRQNDYVVTGEQLEIPASVKGWLEVVPDDGRPVEYFDSIEGIAGLKPKRFLVRTSIVGYQLTTDATGNCCWMPYEVTPGEILTTGIVYVDTKKAKTAPHGNLLKRLLKHNKTKKGQELTYLQCFDYSECEIMVPVIMSGVFSPVGDSTSANFDSVYELQDLVIAFGLPVSAQVIHANDSFHFPKGVIRFYGMREEELATVSKVEADGILFCDNSNSEKFEIPIDHLLFNRGVVKKKPFIKSKLAEGFSHHNKQAHRGKLECCKKKEVDYVLAKSLENIKFQTTFDERLSASCNGKDNSMYVYNVSKYDQTKMANKDVNSNNVSQDNKHLAKDNWTSSPSSSLPEITTQECFVDENPPHLDSQAPPATGLYAKDSLELPQRVPKELIKSRSSSILDKLSVRRVQKERAKLKELRADDVFSKRISRSELSYQDFFNGIDNDHENSRNDDNQDSRHDDSGQGSSGGTYQGSLPTKATVIRSTSTPNIHAKTNSHTTKTATDCTHRNVSIQKRGLPPIPIDVQIITDSIPPSHGSSAESLYEHLPPAPQRPKTPKPSGSTLQDDVCDDIVVDYAESEEDGYMVPMQMRQEQTYVKRSNAQSMYKALTMTVDPLKTARVRKARGESPRESTQSGCRQNDRQHVDYGDPFNLAYTSTKYGENHPMSGYTGTHTVSTSQLNGTLQPSNENENLACSLENFNVQVSDNLDSEATHFTSRPNYLCSKSLNFDPNAALRSVNLRRHVLDRNELHCYADPFPGIRGGSSLPSFKDAQDSCMQNCYDHQNMYFHNSRPQVFSTRSADAEMVSRQLLHHRQHFNVYGSDYRMNYAESEPNFHRTNNRPASVGGLNDVFFKHGDDSAISMCSRGETGFQTDSDYGYIAFPDGWPGDGWTPPGQLDGLSVQEVSKSLRYIGMKDRVVVRFSKEQIDGSMLCTLDKKLLEEGFPELNALEIKKILDFVQGWRPKKS